MRDDPTHRQARVKMGGDKHLVEHRMLWMAGRRVDPSDVTHAYDAASNINVACLP